MKDERKVSNAIIHEKRCRDAARSLRIVKPLLTIKMPVHVVRDISIRF